MEARLEEMEKLDVKPATFANAVNKKEDYSNGGLDYSRLDNGFFIYKPRLSPYEHLYNTDQNARSIIIVASLTSIFYGLSFIVTDSFKAGRFYWDTTPFLHGLGSLNDIKNSIFIEVFMLVAGFLIYPAFKFWVKLHKTVGLSADIISIALYTAVVIASFVVWIYVKLALNLPAFICVILTVEQLRFCFKSYSFIRENAYKVLYPWHKDDTSGPAVWYAGQMSPIVGSFSQYVYFLFSPTLLYRDHYPREPGPIKWSKVLMYFLMFIVPIIITSQYYARMIDPPGMNASDLLESFFVTVPSGLISAFMGSVCLMHGWMNMFAELLRFADRHFYSDWWNSTSFPDYYRKWNNIPYHFIRHYIYRDIKKITNCKPLLFFVILFASSIIHEYVIASGTGYLIPILTIQFAGIGVIVSVIYSRRSRTLQNVFVMSSLLVGFHINIWFNRIEVKARELCPKEETLVDFLIPRFIEC